MISRCVLLAILAILTLAPTVSEAQSQNPFMSDFQFKKILAEAQANGKDTKIPSEVTTAFGLTQKGETLTMRRLTYNDAKQNQYSFINPNNGNYLFATKFTSGTIVLYVDKNLMLISGLQKIAGKNEFSILPNKEAQVDLNALLLIFARLADTL